MKLRRWAPAFFLGVALILLWWALTASGTIAAGIVPNPVDVVRRIGTSFSAGYMLPAMLTTLGEAAAGCVIAAVVGIPVGYGLAKSPLFSRLVEPYVAVSQAVPAVAVAPLLVIWIGYGFAPITVLCAIMVIFPVIVSTSVGVRGIDHDVLGAARLDGASGWQRFRFITLTHIREVIGLLVILRTIWVFNNFDMLFLLTGGGPGERTTTLPIFAYQEGWNLRQLGVASTVTILLLIFLLVLAFAAFRMLNRWEKERG